MNRHPLVSVIIPTFNKAGVLPATLRALAEQTIEPTTFEVIIVDDGSTDNTPQMLAGLTPAYTYRWICQANKGAGSARNLGASMAYGTILHFLDPDIILEPEALSAHMSVHNKYDQVIVTGRVLPITPNLVGPEDLFFQESFDFGDQEVYLPWHCTITQSLSIKKTHFHQLGCFNTDLIRGQDIELGYRATQAGFEICYCPKIVGRHNHALDIKQRCAVEKRNHQHLIVFYQRYPFLAAEVRYLRYKWPVNWQQDSLFLIGYKLIRHFPAWWPILLTMQATWQVLRRIQILPPQILQGLYWSIVGSHQLLGLKDGIRLYGPIIP